MNDTDLNCVSSPNCYLQGKIKLSNESMICQHSPCGMLIPTGVKQWKKLISVYRLFFKLQLNEIRDTRAAIC